jgi:hypothetical protein
LNEISSSFLVYINNHANNIKHTKVEKFIMKCYDKTRTFLRQNQDVFILNSDKGAGAVAVFDTDYENKIKQLLSDTET